MCSSSCSIVLIGKNGKVEEKLNCQLSLPQGYVIPEGCLISWRDHIPGENDTMRRVQYRSATIVVERKSEVNVGYYVGIECTDAADFDGALALLTKIVGGETKILSSLGNNSFVGGVRNDLSWLGQRIHNGFRSMRQRIGIRIASIGYDHGAS